MQHTEKASRPVSSTQPKRAASSHSAATAGIHVSPRMVAQRQQLRRLFGPAVQLQSELEKNPNRTGLPDGLKAGVESLSGMSLDDIDVHYNSSQPGQLNAHAYAQGSQIHLAPGQEQHLPHEAWHVVQQRQGRVKPMLQMANGMQVNNDAELEQEADLMGGRAMAAAARLQSEQREGMPQPTSVTSAAEPSLQAKAAGPQDSAPVQMVGWLAAALLATGIVITTSVIHDLYQRYKRYIQPADRTAEHLRAGGVHGQTENAALNVEQGLDTFEQAHDLRSARQDDTRAHLSLIGSRLSSGLRAGHSDKDEILMRAIQSEFPGRDNISEEELEFAIQKAILGATRTRGSLTGAARAVGGAADYLSASL